MSHGEHCLVYGVIAYTVYWRALLLLLPVPALEQHRIRGLELRVVHGPHLALASLFQLSVCYVFMFTRRYVLVFYFQMFGAFFVMSCFVYSRPGRDLASIPEEASRPLLALTKSDGSG